MANGKCGAEWRYQARFVPHDERRLWIAGSRDSLTESKGLVSREPPICPACESRYWVEHQSEAARLVVHRVTMRPGRRLTLHEEIRAILLEHGKKLGTVYIAREVNKRSRYHKKDGSVVTTLQVHGRTREYPKIFTRHRNMVGLVEWAWVGRPRPAVNEQTMPMNQLPA